MAFKKLDYAKMLRIVYSQSGTVCRFTRRIDELLREQGKLLKELKEYKDMARLDERENGRKR